MGDVQLPANFLKEFAALKAEVRALRKRAPLTNSAISSGGLTIQDGGDVTIKGGGSLVIKDGGSVLIEDAAGNILVQLGTLPDANYGLVVNDNAGVPQVRAGELESGGYGLESVDPSTGHLVQLSTLAFGLASSSLQIFPAETTASATLTDLATVGPSVTVTIGSSGRALVTVTALLAWTANRGCVMGYAVSGATTTAADLNHTLAMNSQDPTSNNSTGNSQGSATFLVTGLTPGANTFTAKYATMFSGSVAFGPYRGITVQPF